MRRQKGIRLWTLMMRGEDGNRERVETRIDSGEGRVDDMMTESGRACRPTKGLSQDFKRKSFPCTRRLRSTLRPSKSMTNGQICHLVSRYISRGTAFRRWVWDVGSCYRAKRVNTRIPITDMRSALLHLRSFDIDTDDRN